MANETLITDLVAQEALDQLAALDQAMQDTLEQYNAVGRELAKGLKIPVEVQGDLDKITQVYNTQMRNAAQATQQLTTIQQQVIANTTNTISRALAEQEKLNKQYRVTESVTTSAIVATATPITEIALITLMACVDFFENRYLRAMKNGKFMLPFFFVYSLKFIVYR